MDIEKMQLDAESYTELFGEGILKVNGAIYLDGYRILISFSNGHLRIVDLQGKLDGPAFKRNNDIEFFKKFQVKYGTITWKNRTDLAPEFLYLNGQEVELVAKAS